EETRAAAASLDDLLRRDAGRLRDHLGFSGLDRWLHRIYPGAVSVLDYAEAAGFQLVVDEPLRVRHRLDAAQAEFYERIRAMLEKGQIPGESTEVLWRGEDIANRLRRGSRVIALAQIAAAGNGLPNSFEVSLRGQTVERWRGREQAMEERIRDWQDQQGETILFCGNADRVKRMQDWLQEKNLQIHLSEAAFKEGFIWPAAGLMVIGMQDLFGSDRKTRRRRRSHGLKIDLFSDLVSGELVVYEAHGIGRYMGLVNLETNGMRRDYLHIQYSGEDALYLPMESLDQIQKYVGTDGRLPKLSRLGGQEWNRLKERARSSIKKLATDLVSLYAQRMAIKGHVFSADTIWQREFEELFPYEETDDQIRAIQEIKADKESDKVMDRLLCGDVGFGKTEVAFRAMFKCVMDGRQAVLLAPTTVLAMQHYDNFKRRAADYPLEIGLLSRFAPEALQKKTLAGLKQGTIDVLIGTHRIFSKDVHIRNLGLLVVDEEQRFGVDHKEMIKAISPNVDVLTLTATPIPRTLHMTMSGIRDISVLEEAPHDRRPVQTYVMEFDQDIVNEAILREISRRGQVFYLYNDTHRIIEKARSLETMLPGARVI
ncbi:MAG: DEAD/DEAH box helicase, partial [Clostridiaceae bacterium]|nr:DEAD/DEAH box helicase [Clostridiaceae bacterium]